MNFQLTMSNLTTIYPGNDMKKKYLKLILNRLLQSPIFRLIYWYCRSPFSNFAAYAFFKERVARDLRINGDYRVRFGPYQGMKYTKHGSSVSLSCLLGTYEMEIWPAIEEIKYRDYRVIIDVGCAEGYHACGLALITGKPVMAYDTNEIARYDCHTMAAKNLITHQIQIGEYLSHESLESLCSQGNAFLFCDVDYYEVEILDLNKVPSLASTDILVETHGHSSGSENDTMPLLLSRFEDTHDIEIFKMMPRHSFELWQFADKSKNSEFAIGNVVNEPLCHAFIEERGWNNWLWMKAKNNIIK